MGVWLRGLMAAAVGGTSSALTAFFAVPEKVNFSREGLAAMGQIAAAGAVVSVLAYLKQSPIPKDCDATATNVDVRNVPALPENRIQEK